METQSILHKRISLCPNVQAKAYRSISLFEALNSIRTGNYEKQIGNIRCLLINNNIQSYKAKKSNYPRIFSQELHLETDTNLTLVDILH